MKVVGGGLATAVGASGGLDGDRGHGTFPRSPERADLPIGPEVGKYVFPTLDKRGGGGASGLSLDCPAGVELDGHRYLEGRLTEAQRAFFDRNGFLLIENALPADHHEAVLAAVDECRAETISSGQNQPGEMTHAAGFSPARKATSDAAGVLLAPFPLSGCNTKVRAKAAGRAAAGQQMTVRRRWLGEQFAAAPGYPKAAD